jgi:hypothetical protein
MVALGIHELRKQTREEFPDADLSEVFGRTRERVVDAVKDANIGERASKLRESAARSVGGNTAGDEGGGYAGGNTGEEARLKRLERLAALHEKGVLSDEELASEKARVLGSEKADS